MKVLDNIYIINLRQDKYKWSKIEETFGKENLTPKRIEAIYGKELSPKEYKEKTTYACNLFCTPAIVGCFLSHLSIWEKMVRDDISECIIGEDDIALVDNFKTKFAEIKKQLPVNWEIVTLSCNGPCNMTQEYSLIDTVYKNLPIGKNRTHKKISENIFVPEKVWGTHFYMINKKCAEKLINKMNKASYHVDHVLFSQDIELYSTYPYMAKPDFSSSGIGLKTFDFPVLDIPVGESGVTVNWYLHLPICQISKTTITVYKILVFLLVMMILVIYFYMSR